MRGASASPALLAGLSALLLAAAAAAFLLPARTHLAVYAHDVLVFFDGIHRLDRGQLPSRDFETPLGLLAYALPWIGAEIAGGVAGAIEAGSVLLAALLLAVAAMLLAPRAGPVPAAMALAAVAAMTVVPLTPGEPGTEVSPAMAYNRWGWAALTVLFLLGLPPARAPGPARAAAEAGAAALLLLVMALLKASYALVGAAFLLAFALLRPELRRTAAWWLGGALAGLAALELATGLVSANIADIAVSAAASPGLRPSLPREIVENAPAYALLAIGYGAAAAAGRLGVREAAFALFVAGSGAAILNQNYHTLFVLPLLVLFLDLGRMLAGTGRAWLPAVLAAAFLLPQAVAWALATLVHLTAPATAAPADLPRLERVTVGERAISALDGLEARDPRAAFYAARTRQPAQILSQSEYAETLRDGVALLRRHRVEGTVLALAFANPFPALLDLPPQPGAYSWIHPGRNFTPDRAHPPERFLGGVDHLMVPRYPVAPATLSSLVETYGAAIEAEFALLEASPYWRLYARRPAERTD